jgi:hypothetical protein
MTESNPPSHDNTPPSKDNDAQEKKRSDNGLKKEETAQNPTTQNINDSTVKIAKISAWQAIIVALITTLGGGIAGFVVASVNVKANKPNEEKAPSLTVVPVPANIRTVPSLGKSDTEGTMTLRDISIFDLRAWKDVPEAEKATRYSPVNYINYLHVKKTKAKKEYLAHYTTTGIAIDLRCITHDAEILEVKPNKEHPGTMEKTYAVRINIETMPIDKEFLIVIEGTYWNSFQSPGEQSASTYTDRDISQLDEIALIVLLPDNKPCRNVKYWGYPDGKDKKTYRESARRYEDVQGRFIYWSILERAPDHHYKVTWEW